MNQVYVIKESADIKEFLNNSRIIMEGKKKDGMYQVELKRRFIPSSFVTQSTSYIFTHQQDLKELNLRIIHLTYLDVARIADSTLPKLNIPCESCAIGKLRAMLVESNLPKEYWGEALLCSTYTRNRSPTEKLITPFQLLFKQKPSLKHLQNFGTVAYVHIQKHSKKKLDPLAI
ncbi:hypothetical protein ROZALSC1DRAFT_23449 [Rozella allomycis CSF55]|uniref:GAG-pre-integrase domain-containing protein n=1 Tax=Rozella allomycis (strain CSF55) TaxID=988480 RepID=A0A4P9YG00_ROZAC|nr:hypothetical protein ROZALSC1DRAFT_23449 [Rozella allomycis CSF55]